MKPETASFAMTGIYPFNRGAAQSTDLQPSTVHAADAKQSFSLAESFVASGTIQPQTTAVFPTPIITPRRLPPAASQACSLTSEVFTAPAPAG